MHYVEFGKENNNIILLLHGGGLSWWNYKEAAEALQKDYRIILPILDGHAGSNRPFTTIADNAAEIISFIDTHLGGSVLLIGGLSLGGQIALEILSQRKNVCKCAIIESALVIPSRFTYSMIKPAFGSCYGFIQHKWFSKLQFKSLKMKAELFDDYFKDSCAIAKKDMIAFLQENSVYSLKDSVKNCMARVYIFVGSKENRIMRKSSAIIHQSLQNSLMQVLPGLYHGEFSVNHGKDYANMIRQIIAESQIPICETGRQT